MQYKIDRMISSFMKAKKKLIIIGNYQKLPKIGELYKIVDMLISDNLMCNDTDNKNIDWSSYAPEEYKEQIRIMLEADEIVDDDDIEVIDI